MQSFVRSLVLQVGLCGLLALSPELLAQPRPGMPPMAPPAVKPPPFAGAGQRPPVVFPMPGAPAAQPPTVAPPTFAPATGTGVGQTTASGQTQPNTNPANRFVVQGNPMTPPNPTTGGVPFNQGAVTPNQAGFTPSQSDTGTTTPGTTTGGNGTTTNGATVQAFTPTPPSTDSSVLIRNGQGNTNSAASPSTPGGSGTPANPTNASQLSTDGLLRGLADVRVSNLSNLNGGDVINISTSFNKVQIQALEQSLRASAGAQSNAQVMTQMMQQRGLLASDQVVVGFMGGKVYVASSSELR